MIPLRDTTRSKTWPIVNYLLILSSVLVFLVELTLSQEEIGSFMITFGLVPARLHEFLGGSAGAFPVILPLVTSMFIHGGWMHLIGNMLFLHVFGDNVEDRLGHGGYMIFYLLCGTGAGTIESLIQGPTQMPLIGASGAIAGVLGAYFILYPRAKVLTLIPLFLYFPIVELSAFFFLGFWFVMQFFNAALTAGNEGGGVAWWAHAGGFVVGTLLLPVFLTFRRFTR